MMGEAMECQCGKLKYRITGHNERLGSGHKSTFEVVAGVARIDIDRVICRECRDVVMDLPGLRRAA